MTISIISFTEQGRLLSKRVKEALRKEATICLYTKCSVYKNDRIYVPSSVRDWAEERIQEKSGLLFIGACAIAVRAVAPFLTDKLHDVPILVMDEAGRYVIPILSGHMGGANEIAKHIALKTGAEPVITTATDLRQAFAVDLFAKKNGLSIVNKAGIAKVSSKVLAGKEVSMSIESGHEIKIEKSVLPLGVCLVPYPPDGSVDIVVTSENHVFDALILLKPKEYVFGIGCKRGKTFREIDAFISKKLTQLGISTLQLFAIASISRKEKEQGIIQWCQKEGIPFLTYTAETLQEEEGTFTESSFVRSQVGVGNVCERAALKACREGGKLIQKKEAENGMTIAVAQREWKVSFDEK